MGDNYPILLMAALSASSPYRLHPGHNPMRNILYPNIKLAQLPAMLGYAVLGALVAGAYGIMHDQVTYTISVEYFTKLKFAQFHYANFGLPPRVFVAEIGFLATWWVGFFGGWLIARVAVPRLPADKTFRYSLRSYGIMLSVAFLGSTTGYLYGLRPHPDYAAWLSAAEALHLCDLPSFVRVAYIHNASYLGGLVGLIAAVVYIRRCTHFEAAHKHSHP
jgi:hypothetical protein